MEEASEPLGFSSAKGFRLERQPEKRPTDASKQRQPEKQKDDLNPHSKKSMEDSGKLRDVDFSSMQIVGGAIHDWISSMTYVFQEIHSTISPVSRAESWILAFDAAL